MSRDRPVIWPDAVMLLKRQEIKSSKSQTWQGRTPAAAYAASLAAFER